MARTLREKPSMPVRNGLVQYAKAHPKDQNGALALLALAFHDIEAKNPDRAIPVLKNLDKRLPKLEDYINLFLARALLDNGQYKEAAKVAIAITNSPVETRAAGIAVEAYRQLNQSEEAVKLIRARYTRLDQPGGELALAQALEGAGDQPAAAVGYRGVYSKYPKAPEANDALAAMERLGVSLTAQERYERAQRALDLNMGAEARTEFRAVLNELVGVDRETAAVRLGAAYYQARENSTALRYLRELKVTTKDLDAERLYWAVLAARRAKEFAILDQLAAEAAKKHPSSRWTTGALAEAGNTYLATEDYAKARGFYEDCGKTLTDSTLMSWCAWKVAFDRYMKRSPQAFQAMNNLVEKYPGSPQVSAALYYMGRLAEGQKDLTTAKSFYLRIDESFPNHYYAVLARERLREPGLKNISAQPARADLTFPKPPAATFDVDSGTQLRMARAEMLAIAGLGDYGEQELRAYSRDGGPSHLVAMSLAQLAVRRGEYARGVRFVKSLFPGYLYQPLDQAPTAFWKLTYPMPYREDLERFAKSQSLDPFLVAGLIRQESEFNPSAVSRAKAQGLMQVMPATGRELSRKLGVRPYSTARLLEPKVSLQMGTYHFKNWLDALDGQVEVTLAAYNAGKSRADRWIKQAQFREPSEFVEMIPWTETREYVQSVLRNADVYRRLYGGMQRELYATPKTPIPSKNAASAKDVRKSAIDR